MASRWGKLSRSWIALAVGVAAVLLLVALASTSPDKRGTSVASPADLPSLNARPSAAASASPDGETLLAVGDIGNCDSRTDDRVAARAANLPGTIALLGDLVYPDGSAANYRDCFEPSWGPMLSRIRPAVGNHDYTEGGSIGPYFDLFGTAAGDRGFGWYSYDLGTWHVVVLNSNCDKVGGCGPNSPQMAWLQLDLADHPSQCLLAYWHHSRWSSGRHGNQEQVEALWNELMDADVRVTLHGHDHDYERLELDGVTSFVVGTGGNSLYEFERDAYPSTATRQDQAYGLLELQLRDGSFQWRYVPLGGSDFTDGGAASC